LVCKRYGHAAKNPNALSIAIVQTPTDPGDDVAGAARRDAADGTEPPPEETTTRYFPLHFEAWALKEMTEILNLSPRLKGFCTIWYFFLILSITPKVSIVSYDFGASTTKLSHHFQYQHHISQKSHRGLFPFGRRHEMIRQRIRQVVILQFDAD